METARAFTRLMESATPSKFKICCCTLQEARKLNKRGGGSKFLANDNKLFLSFPVCHIDLASILCASTLSCKLEMPSTIVSSSVCGLLSTNECPLTDIWWIEYSDLFVHSNRISIVSIRMKLMPITRQSAVTPPPSAPEIVRPAATRIASMSVDHQGKCSLTHEWNDLWKESLHRRCRKKCFLSYLISLSLVVSSLFPLSFTLSFSPLLPSTSLRSSLLLSDSF